MSNPVGDCCCSAAVSTPCCGGVAPTLFLTFDHITGPCSCLETKVVPLVYEGGPPALWRGEISRSSMSVLCGWPGTGDHSLGIEFECGHATPTCASTNWYLQMIDNDPGGGGFIDVQLCAGATTCELDSASCGPTCASTCTPFLVTYSSVELGINTTVGCGHDLCLNSSLGLYNLSVAP